MIVDLCPYWVTPITGGGPLRVYNLNKFISEEFSVSQFSFRPTSIMRKLGQKILQPSVVSLSDNYREFRLSNPLIIASSILFYKLGLPPDYMISRFAYLMRNNYLTKCLNEAKIVQIEHPWLFDFARNIDKRSLIVLSSHNCENILYAKCISSRIKDKLIEIEKRSIELSDIVLAVSSEDIENFHRILNINDKDNIFVIPNGVDCHNIRKITDENRLEAKKRLGLVGKKVILFMGSIHLPNWEAMRIIEERISKQIKDDEIIFLIMGSVGEGSKSHDNIIYTGHLPEKDPYIMASDIAINPLISGSGTNLKLLEYMAYGLPVVTTDIGARGLQVEHLKHVIVSTISDFEYWLPSILDNDELSRKLSFNARLLVETNYDWKNIAKKVCNIYTKFIQ